MHFTIDKRWERPIRGYLSLEFRPLFWILGITGHDYSNQWTSVYAFSIYLLPMLRIGLAFSRLTQEGYENITGKPVEELATDQKYGSDLTIFKPHE